MKLYKGQESALGSFFMGGKVMLKKVLKKIEKLNADKIKFIDEQSKIQKKINDIEIEIKDYTTIKLVLSSVFSVFSTIILFSVFKFVSSILFSLETFSSTFDSI